MFRLGGVRTRLTISLVALVAVTAIVLGVGAAWFVDLRLHDQALQDGAAQARFDLSVVVPGRQLPAEPTLDDIDRSALRETFQQRGVETLVDLGPRGEYRSNDRLDGLIASVPQEMHDRVDRGELAFVWLDVGGTPSLIIGGRPAEVDAAFYFVRDVRPIRAAVDQLRLALAVGGLVLVLLSLVVARRVAREILAPVEEAGQVAERIERGDLSARVPVTTRDEFGAWAERFNAMTAALSDTIRRLEASQQQNRRFVADVSHELRTPLTALVAEASIVGEHLDDLPPESRRAAELLVGDVRRLRALVEELMELSRFDADVEEVAVEPVDLVRLVRSVVGARLPTARFVPPASSVVVDTDPRRLERILGNFLDNARDHAGGVEVDVSLEVGAEELIIAVADRGPGVPPDRLDRIFERFARLDPSRDRGTGGSGLGLAIAAEHAALLGGYLQAMEREGGGLRLELVLPNDVTGSLRDGDESVIGESDDGTPPSTTRERPS